MRRPSLPPPSPGPSLFLALLTMLLGPHIAAASTSASSYPASDILSGAQSLQPWLVSTRRDLHRIPELGYQEHKTSSYITQLLDSYNISYKSGVATTGVVASIGSGRPVVLLRADMDALPVQEPEGFEARSEHDGRMHACGHDTHMTMLLGAARLLQQRQQQLPGGLAGTVKLVFQPFEEGGAGADIMIKTGELDDVEAAFGIHVMPHLRTGVFGTRVGTIMAGSLVFHITVSGRGGHAAMPHGNIDPIVAAAAIITSLQPLISRETSPLSSGVVSVTLLRAGEGAYNVIPSTAELGGTIRALDQAHLLHLQRRVEAVSTAVAQGYGCGLSVDWMLEEHPLYPPTVNDAATVEFTRGVAAGLFAPSDMEDVEPLMAGEDFAFFCIQGPCTYAWLGIRNETAGSVHALHNPRFTMDETVLHKGSALHAAWALAYLDAHQPPAAACSHKEEL